MILDERLEFCDGTNAAKAAGNAILGDVIDLGATPTLRDIGAGEPLYLVIQAETAFTGAGNLTFELRSDSGAALTESPTTHLTAVDAEAYTVWTAGHMKVVALPQEVAYERYLGIWYTTSGTITGGTTNSTVNIFLTCDPSRWTAYDNGI